MIMISASSVIVAQFQSLFYWMNLSTDNVGMFQSLFHWMYLSDSSKTSHLWDGWVFQSLFNWMCILNNVPFSLYSIVFFVFQSLFYWISLLNSYHVWLFLEPVEFQSLFYWMRFSNITLCCIFQSLFYWICVLSFYRATTHRLIVSDFNPCSIGYMS